MYERTIHEAVKAKQVNSQEQLAPDIEPESFTRLQRIGNWVVKTLVKFGEYPSYGSVRMGVIPRPPELNKTEEK